MLSSTRVISPVLIAIYSSVYISLSASLPKVPLLANYQSAFLQSCNNVLDLCTQAAVLANTPTEPCTNLHTLCTNTIPAVKTMSKLDRRQYPGAASNLQPFSGALYDVTPPGVLFEKGMFVVSSADGTSRFESNQLADALYRSCSYQHTQCELERIQCDGDVKELDGICDAQRLQCIGTLTRPSIPGRSPPAAPRTSPVQPPSNFPVIPPLVPPGGTPISRAGPPATTLVPPLSQFCLRAGLPSADGTQKQTASCSTTIQGAIPSSEKMISTIITAPDFGASLPRDQPISIDVKVANMDLGLSVNSTTQYYSEPQTLNAQGLIEGHLHLAVQRIVSLQEPPDARNQSLAFFASLNQEDNNGLLNSVIPPNTLTLPGAYRICTVSGSKSHQPVLMPVARRGGQDDCVRINVS